MDMGMGFATKGHRTSMAREENTYNKSWFLGRHQ
jgi:hypothetical protein